MTVLCWVNNISEGGEYNENMGKNSLSPRERDRYQIID